MTNINIEKYKLFWVCKETGTKLPAGVAFYNDRQGDYRLKVDVLPDDKQVFLKLTSTQEGAIFYRIETLVRKNGLPTHRTPIGSGYSKAENGMPIMMDLGPYSKTLVMEEVQK